MAQTLNDVYLKTITIPREAIMKYKKGGQWHDITVPEFALRVRHLSVALHNLGIKNDDRVAILSENRPEWTMADFAIIAAGGVGVPIYPTLLAWQIEYILNDSGATIVFASSKEQLDKILALKDHCPSVRAVIIFDDVVSSDPIVSQIDRVIADGRRAEETEGKAKFDERVKQRKPEDLATIVYTSGTTGNPKGAMLTHDNLVSNLLATCQLIPLKPGLITLSVLPLSHILERLADYAFLYSGCCIAYAESVLTVADDLAAVRPHFFAAVPRLFEKMKARILDKVAEAPPARQKIFHWALGVGAERLPYVIESKPMPLGLSIKSKLADKLVFKKIKERLGGRVQFVLSGGAPLSAELAAFFIGAGIEILEGYGLTETSPVIAINTLEHRRLGTVGKAIPRVEVRIAEDGEILTRGPHVMRGYFNNPEATAQAIDKDGWFHTGDIGVLDKDGFLKITDRKKDLIINAYGKNIAPQPLEGLLKTSPYIGTPVLIGDRRKFLSAIIVPNFEMLEREAKLMGLNIQSREELVKTPQIKHIVQKEIDRFNQNLDRQEHIRRFSLLPADFSIEGGEITPSLKVKRKVVDEKYKSLIDDMYRNDAD